MMGLPIELRDEQDEIDALRLMRHFPDRTWDGTLHHAVLIVDAELTDRMVKNCPGCGDVLEGRALFRGVCHNCSGTRDDPNWNLAARA